MFLGKSRPASPLEVRIATRASVSVLTAARLPVPSGAFRCGHVPAALGPIGGLAMRSLFGWGLEGRGAGVYFVRAPDRAATYSRSDKRPAGDQARGALALSGNAVVVGKRFAVQTYCKPGCKPALLEKPH